MLQHNVAALRRVAGNVAQRPHGLLAHVLRTTDDGDGDNNAATR